MTDKLGLDHLVIGSNGLVGKYLGKVLSKQANSIWIGLGKDRLNLTNSEEVKRTLYSLQPKNVFHCANLRGGVNFCEQNATAAREFHLQGTINLGLVCREIGARLIFISTDYVFADHPDPIAEDHPARPLNTYGQCKWEAEEWLKTNLPTALIARTTNVYGYDPESKGPNFFMQVWSKLRQGEEFPTPSYLWGNPTFALDLAQGLYQLVEAKAQGIFHVVGPEFMNRLQWASEIGQFFKFDTRLVLEQKEPVSRGPHRPHYLQLGTAKLKKTLDFEFHSHQEALQNIAEEISNKGKFL